MKTVTSAGRNGMSVAIDSFSVQDLGNGYTRYFVQYTELNETTLAIDQATLKLYFSNGEPSQQYGFFGILYPGEQSTKVYEFTVSSAFIPSYLEYDADHFFSDYPVQGALQWSVDGSSLALVDSSNELSGSFDLSVIVDAGVLGGGAVYLKDLTETVIYENGSMKTHTVEYAGTVFDYDAIDALITTVVRDGDFTQEFQSEISDGFPSAAYIEYGDLLGLVGVVNVEAVLLHVAGVDGSYVH